VGVLVGARGDFDGRFGLFEGTELDFDDKTVLGSVEGVQVGSTEGSQVGYSEGIEEGN